MCCHTSFPLVPWCSVAASAFASVCTVCARCVLGVYRWLAAGWLGRVQPLASFVLYIVLYIVMCSYLVLYRSLSFRLSYRLSHASLIY